MSNRPLPPHTKRYSEQAKKVFAGARFEVYQWQQRQFDGSTATYEVVKRNDTVIILPIIDGEIVLVREQQPHWDRSGLTLVAGMVEPDEDLAAAARREVEEETGLIFTDYKLAHIDGNAPGIEWFSYTYIATGYVGEKAKKLDAGEKNEVVKISLDKLIELSKKRELVYHARFIEDMVLQDKLAELEVMLFSC